MKNENKLTNQAENEFITTSEDLSLSAEEMRSATIAEADAAEKALDEKTSKKKKSISRELLRFLVVGVICTVVDFVCTFLTLKIFESNLSQIENWGFYVAYAIAIVVGFVISTIVNYVSSKLWVFQNVDKKSEPKKSFMSFFGLGGLALLLGIALQEGGVLICNNAWNVGISYDITKVSLKMLFSSEGVAFWCFVAIFGIKTAVTMVFNYITRKIFIFKAPKPVEEFYPVNLNTEPEPIVEEKQEAPVVEEEPKLVTKSAFQKMFKEELETRFGPGQHKMNKEKAWKMVNEEIDKREESGTNLK